MSASQSTQNIHASLRNTRINVQPDSRIVSVPVPAPAPLELGKYVQHFHDFLTHAGLQHKDYQTQGIQFCLRNEMRRGGGGGATAMDQTCVFGGIVADEMGLGKTIMMIGLTISNFKKRTLIVLPVALVKQWEQQILKTAGHHALIFYGPEKRKITPEMLAEAPIVITTYGHMIRRPNSHRLHPLYALKWDRVIFDEAHHVRGRNTQIFKSVETLSANIRWFVTGTPIQNSIHDLYALCALLGLPAAYYANKDNLREIVQTYVLKRTKKSVGLSLPPLTTKTIVVKWDSQEEMILSRNLHSGIGCLNVPALADQEQDQDPTDATTPPSIPAWFPEPSPVKIGRMIQAKQSCIYPRLTCRKSVPRMPPTEDENYSSKISKVVRTILSRKDNGKRKIVFCHFRGEIDYIQARITTAFPSLVVRYLDGRTSESERRVILAPDAAINVLILQIQTCCEGLNLQQFSEVYFVSPDWNPAVEDQAIARCHRFGQTEPVSVFRFIMAPLRIRATPEMIEQQQLQDPQQQQQQQQQPEDAASQASTASQPDADTDDTLDADHNDSADGCIAIDTIEAYTANIQNKKRIFAEEVLSVV
jgi:SNF2 family DNA or RNA helicase